MICQEKNLVTCPETPTPPTGGRGDGALLLAQGDNCTHSVLPTTASLSLARFVKLAFSAPKGSVLSFFCISFPHLKTVFIPSVPEKRIQGNQSSMVLHLPGWENIYGLATWQGRQDPSFFLHYPFYFLGRNMRLQNTQLSSGGTYITPNSPIDFNEERSVLPRKKLLLWAVWLLKEGHSTGANLRKMEHLQISKHLQMQNKFSSSYRHS